MERKDVGGNMVEISHENVVDQWLVIKKRLEASALVSLTIVSIFFSSIFLVVYIKTSVDRVLLFSDKI